MKRQHWQDWVNFALGLWMFVSPWLLQSAAVSETAGNISTIAAWNMYIVGILIAATAIGALTVFQTWEEWVNVIFGAWLLFSPWLLGVSSLTLLTWNSVIVGAIVVVFAVWVIATAKTGEQRSPFL